MIKNTIFDGKPTRELPERPFLSIVIACYESIYIEPLLKSIASQDMNDEIEVILSDDCSPDQAYLEICHKYDDILSIKYVQTDYNFGPGNTRERGVQAAEGKWLAIADHDDEYIPKSLPIVKKLLEETGEERLGIANFYEREPNTGKILGEMVHTYNWNHAKFYNLDNFWRKYNIHFKKDLLTHEDIYISSTVNAINSEHGFRPTFLDVFCYFWNNRPTTISRKKYGNHEFQEVFMIDYLESTGGLYLEKAKDGTLNKEVAFWNTIDVMLYLYFFISSFMFHHPEDYMKENVEAARKYLVDIKSTFEVTNEDILEYVSRDEAEMYRTVEPSAIMSAGPSVPKYSFYDFLEWLHADVKKRQTLKDVRKKVFDKSDKEDF